jgi:predicted RNase H-like HicB family nuclease
MIGKSQRTILHEEGRHYVAQCQDIDVYGIGETQQEALDNLQEARELYYYARSLDL